MSTDETQSEFRSTGSVLDSETLIVTDNGTLLSIIDSPREQRPLEMLERAEQELNDRVWYDRHMSHSHNDGTDCPCDKPGCDGAQGMRVKYGAEALGPYTDFEWGMLNGKLSALRWARGDYWDDLDT